MYEEVNGFFYNCLSMNQLFIKNTVHPLNGKHGEGDVMMKSHIVHVSEYKHVFHLNITIYCAACALYDILYLVQLNSHSDHRHVHKHCVMLYIQCPMGWGYVLKSAIWLKEGWEGEKYMWAVTS